MRSLSEIYDTLYTFFYMYLFLSISKGNHMYTQSERLTKFSQDFHEIVCLKQLRYFLFNRSFSAQRANHMCLFWLSSTYRCRFSAIPSEQKLPVSCGWTNIKYQNSFTWNVARILYGGECSKLTFILFFNFCFF